MTPGLVSITFRKLSPREIIGLCLRNGLRAIEWGGDVHVPAGDEKCAEQVGELTRSPGLSVAAYGSYYRLASGGDFPSVLASAAALGAPVIRVWAGELGSAETAPSKKKAVAEDALRCADLAAAHGITLAYEFHRGTLTDTTESALELLLATEHPHIKSLWQPPHELPLQERVASLRAVLPRLQHLHVFHWQTEPPCRRPLAEGHNHWTAYVEELRREGKNTPLLLEFVRGDSPDSLREDAETLREICEN